jgi:4-hydroxyphenylacetate 3-monooxygenase
MALRSGAEYKSCLGDGRAVQLHGTMVSSVVDEPAFQGSIDTVARAYDSRADPAQAALLTIEAKPGASLSRAYAPPRSCRDLQGLAAMIEHIARGNGGTMARMPEYVPLILIGLLDGLPLIAAKHPDWAANLERYHEQCGQNDLFLSHSFADRQVDRSASSEWVEHLTYEPLADGAIQVTGIKAVATSAPITDEFLVLTPPRNGLAPGQALFFAVPVAAAGLTFVCRQPLSHQPAADYPLSARFDEMDAWAVFDKVRVPAERVFLAGDVALVARLWRNLLTLAYYHILIRLAVKADLFLGTASLIAEHLGLTGYQGIQENLADIARYRETIRAFVRAAEAEAITSETGIVMPRPHLLAVGHMYAVEHHHRLREIVLGIAGQSVLMAPSVADQCLMDLPSPGHGGEDEARRRIFRLGWDLAGGAFAGRQYMFETFNGRDLTRNRLSFVERYDFSAAQMLARELACGAMPGRQG